MQRFAALFLLLPAAVCADPILDFSAGFAGATSTLNFNNAAMISGTRASVTNGSFVEVGTVWSKSQVDIRKFSSHFTFQINPPPPNSLEAGFTFTIQRAGNKVCGYPFEALGSSPISPSVTLKFDTWPNVSTTGVYLNGAFPGDDPPASIDMLPQGIDLHTGHVFDVLLTYDGITLHQVVTDTLNGAVFTHDYPIDLPSIIGGIHGYVGFTGSTGSGNTSTQEILTWTYSVLPSVCDIDFTAFPEHSQVYPRNRMTNLAIVPIAGQELVGGFNQALLRVYRNGVQVGSDQSQTLTYTSGRAPFSFNPTITAELATYDLELWLRNGAGDTLVRRATNIVAGDVFVIQGESNATALEYLGSANAYINPFVRTFGAESFIPETASSLASWEVANGNGSIDVVGGVGQWGLVLAHELMIQHSVPIAVFNGGNSGQPVEFFQRNDANPTDAATNYGRLLSRLRSAGVDGAVRSILYYQGESDFGNGFEYESGFTNLRSDWLLDYPTTERIYVFQLREGGAGVSRFDLDLRNRQRHFADQFPNLSVFSTNGLDGHSVVQYNFTNGYETLGLNAARALRRDLYGVPITSNTDPPNPSYAVLAGANHNLIRIPLRNRTDVVTFQAGATADFAVTDAPVSVTGGTITNGVLELQLSGNAIGVTTILYTGHSGDGGQSITGKWVSNTNGIGLVSFIEPVQFDAAPPVITLIGANPLSIEVGGSYVEPGATASDNLDGNVTSSIAIDASAINTAVPGNYPVTYSVSDIAGNAAQTTRTVHVNGSPSASSGAIATNEDTPKPVTLLGSDTDGDPVTFVIVQNPLHGALSGAAPNLTYTPGLNYNGSDSFDFKTNDGTHDSNIATISISITPVNDPPIAVTQSVATNKNTPVAVTLTGNDIETPPANLNCSVTVIPTHGILSGTAPKLTYTPATGYFGADSFKFTVTDTGDGTAGPLTSAEATISIDVIGPRIRVEQPPGSPLIDGVSSVGFGLIARNANNSHTFVIKNTGVSDLTSITANVDGINADQFSITASPAGSLVPGGSTNLTIMFTPTALGPLSAALHIASNDPAHLSFGVALTGTGITNLEAWRLQYFGSIENTGDGADSNDFDLDGLLNLVEFATGTDPKQGNAMPGIITVDATSDAFVYDQAKSAIGDGLTFTVQWTNDLANPNWSNSGVVEQILGEDATLRHIKASVQIAGSNRKFLRLQVTRP
jgi:hypothetical protein